MSTVIIGFTNDFLYDIMKLLCGLSELHRKKCTFGERRCAETADIEIEALIEQILANPKLQRDEAEAGVYRDEPILRPASRLDSYVPDEIRQMKKLAESFTFYRQSAEKRFYDQAVMMAGYEDDFSYTEQFVRYFPTYETMDVRQLRGYFSWRTKVRHGDVQPTSLSFVYVYVYELLNRVCGETPEEGFAALHAFWQTYRAFEPGLDRYLRVWLFDYAVYYGLDKSFLQGLADTEYDEALLALQNGGENERYDALLRLSAYRAEHSRFFREHPDDCRDVVCRVYDALSAYYETHRKKSLFEKCFGQICTCTYHPFASAVFYDRMKYESYTYELNPIHRYRCIYGQWTSEKYHGTRGKSKELGELLRAVDCLMRQKYGYKHLLAPGETPKIILSIIEKEIDAYLYEKKQRAKPRIELDFSKLSGIRQAAAVTRDRLMTDSEREPAEEACPGPTVQEPSDHGKLLDGTERAFLTCLLQGGDWRKAAGNVMPSLLADAINEKLFDRFGDTIIEFDGDAPILVGDYIEELKGIFA